MPTTDISQRLGDQQDGRGTPVVDERSILGLPSELQMLIFQELSDLWSVIALRLTCRHLNSIYLANEERIRSSLVQRLVAPFYAHYKFLTGLWMSKSAVVYPPPSGWPNITPENCRGFAKSSFAVEVLRHLPYVKETHDASDMVNLESYVVDYSEYTADAFNDFYREYRSSDPVPRHVIVIARCRDDGVDVFLDTLSGTVYERTKVQGGGDWMEPCAVDAAKDYFTARERACERLDLVFLPLLGPRTGPHDDADDDKMDAIWKTPFKNEQQCLLCARQLYRRHGWPGDDWRKEEAREALTLLVNTEEWNGPEEAFALFD